MSPSSKSGDFNHLYLNDEVKKVIEAVSLSANGRFRIEFDPTLVRGMGYYTGMIYEIKVDGLLPARSAAAAGTTK
jgi:histidyl-tRNA synthetase